MFMHCSYLQAASVNTLDDPVGLLPYHYTDRQKAQYLYVNTSFTIVLITALAKLAADEFVIFTELICVMICALASPG